MKRANIITLNGYNNYGNRLQNYALTRILEKMNICASTPWEIPLLEKIKLSIKLSPFLRKKYKKEYKLYRFTKKYNSYKKYNNIGDYSIYGSDQIWNPGCIEINKWLLNNRFDKTKQIAYAASIGLGDINTKDKKLFMDSLDNYEAISVREKSAENILQPLTSRKIETVLDPTLLLNANDYELIEKRPANIKLNEKYILCYILGGQEHMEAVTLFAKEKGYKIIIFSDNHDSDYGVEEFLYLIHHAELICTDSFHACVFSFIFERPFVAFKRTGREKHMYTRLQNLISTFQLKNREFDGRAITRENQIANYSIAKKTLEKEQEKSLSFLKKALEDEKK